MSLATRCSACGTIFRVVEDQLRVSDGWVRCGRCAEVFDARAQLFDIDREAPPPWPAKVEPYSREPATPSGHEPAEDNWAPTPAVAASPVGAPFAGENEAASASESGYEAEPSPPPWPQEPPPSEPRPSRFGASQAARAKEPALDEEAEQELASVQDSRFDSRLEPRWSDEQGTATSQTSTPTQAPALPTNSIEPPAADEDFGPDMSGRPDVLMDERLAKISAQAQSELHQSAGTSDAALPEFLRTHPSKTRWQRPAARIALSLSALFLLSTLMLQAGLQFRDTLAALRPNLRPTLQAVCKIAGCEIKPRRYIEGLGVESSALNQAGSGNHYQLVIGLRNKTNTEVATPWIDLSLTDSAGALVARRVLGPADFKTDKLALPAASELALQTMLSTGDARVSGYSVEIFYP
ncbi:zinc-ribbon and DUF3426 domain-containing protein [Roseateles oligotrophus]|uniref:DUF3426 domain-containing protein n=1 Tax=Roseateles oligotrophus TaxID=1769250 RepID=A0ABT2YIZ1_9BURK|nr:DUF3426 domain-containing protein [Roseateles oligotrophus]MCV2370041.1 DUF3426 domain-containing protein [Roseateles oligotrophus]